MALPAVRYRMVEDACKVETPSPSLARLMVLVFQELNPTRSTKAQASMNGGISLIGRRMTARLRFCSSRIWTPGKRRLLFLSWPAMKNALGRGLAFALSTHYWQAGKSILLHSGLQLRSPSEVVRVRTHGATSSQFGRLQGTFLAQRFDLSRGCLQHELTVLRLPSDDGDLHASDSFAS
jgi:hypothetical protein